jgi:putative transposase
VVTAALREDQTLHQLSARFGVHPVVIGDWKRQALVALPGLFGQKVQREAEAVAARERELYEQIGRLEMENAWLKKSSALSTEARRAMIDFREQVSVRHQCRLLGLDRSGLYYEPVGPDAGEVALCHRLDELYTAHPHYGVRLMTQTLRREGHTINPKRVRRLLRQLGLLAVYPKPRLSQAGVDGNVFPHLLRGLAIVRAHQVWAIDITYVRLRGGFAYLVALLDWFSRYLPAGRQACWRGSWRRVWRPCRACGC